ncbi:hypothetical protein PRZ48_010989 [Zasmidium cellare]|uniref:Polyketide synthase n=1 Tax=Zasmidium cellare TaxID=395010 RepID=A0ABR0EA80_ZASCE|nr:hypothetical protein PRZ48_010989 [Zasmidium cellare]
MERSLAPVAIVGMSCRLSGDVQNLSDFWTLLCRSRDGWTTVPSDRFSGEAFYHPNPHKGGCFNTKGGYFMDHDFSKFDAPFFNVTEQEALAMDPQQRQLLECAYEALENGGISTQSVAGTKMGVFIGGAASGYKLHTLRDLSQAPMFEATGNHQSVLAGRISYCFNLRGPCLTSIRSGESDSAIVAASSLHLSPDDTVSMSGLGILNPDGRTYAFDHRAQSGFARGEGTGCLVLKPLDRALKDRDKVWSVLVSSGTNQDGKTAGICMPSAGAQEELIRDVYSRAGISPADTGFVEAHGTGTKVGDPLEVSAISRIFGEDRTERFPLYIGSVKTNIGHLENASGVASVIKASLMLEKGFILPNVNFEKANEATFLEQRHLKVPTSIRPWPKDKRFISINNFGFGGSNAHAVLERLPRSIIDKSVGAYANSPKVFVLSAQDEEAAGRLANNICIYIEQHPEIFQKRLLMDMAYTLCERRTHLSWRIAITASSTNELANALNTSDGIPQRIMGAPKIAFVYTGQGAQWAEMGKDLMNSHSVFANTIRAASDCVKRLGAPFSLFEELAKPEKETLINDASISQPVCTAIQLGLTDLLASWGVKPCAVIGHSSGEICAAYAAGAITIEDAMATAYFRGVVASRMKLVSPSVRGAMIAIGASPAEVKRIITLLKLTGLTVACENSPESVTVSGDEDSVKALAVELDRLKIFTRQLRVDVAYHSSFMEAVAPEYMASIETVHASSGHDGAFYSSLRGAKLDDTSALGAQYWVDNLAKPVLFSTAFDALCRDVSPSVIVEVGPHSALQGPIKQILKAMGTKAASEVKYFPTFVRKQDTCRTALSLAGNLFKLGQDIDFAAVNQTDHEEQRPSLLTNFAPYPWSGHKYWFETRTSKQHRMKPFARHDLLGIIEDTHTNQEPTWTNVISLDDVPWLRDHRMQTLATFPLAGYLCMAVEAAFQYSQMRGRSPDQIAGFKLREFVVSKPLILDEGARYETLVSLRAFSEGTRSYSVEWDEFRVSSWTSSRGWLEHCRGLIAIKTHKPQLRLAQGQLESAARRRDDAKTTTALLCLDTFYSELDIRGAGYSGPFTLPANSNLHGSQIRSVGTILVPDTASVMPMSHETPSVLPTAFVDLFFQLTFAILGAGRGDMATLFMPTAIKEIEINSTLPNKPGDEIQVVASSETDRSLPGPVDFHIDGWHGALAEPVLKMAGFRMTPVNGDVPPDPTPRSLCYGLQWEPLIQEKAANGINGHYDSPMSTVAGPLSGSEFVVITERPDDDQLIAALVSQLHLETGVRPVISSLVAAEVTPSTHVICLSELDIPVLFDMSEQVFVHIKRLLLECSSILWVTAGAYHFAEAPKSNLAQGLLRTIRSELRKVASNLDLDPNSASQPGDRANLIWSALKVCLVPTDSEDPVDFEFAEKQGMLAVPRIVEANAANLSPVVGTYGALDSIYWDDAAEQPLGANEIEIKVAATGMNFKDVVIAMGKVSSPYLGVECSGNVTRVGADVSSLAIGDRVCAMSLGAYSTYARCASTSAAVIPDDMSFETAASIPVVYCTAYYALFDLAHVQAGEKVLIHAAAGGVGQAAIQLAQMIRADVYATVGSEEKRKILHDEYNVPAHRIFYSRDTTFGPAVREATGGEGVDVVINSLAGDLLRETWECLAPFGRFIELGKRDITTNTRLEMAKFEYNCSFSSVDLTLVAASRPSIMRRLLEKVMDLFAQNTIKPVKPILAVSIADMETALRKLQSGMTSGKTVVTHLCDGRVKATHPHVSQSRLHSEATYLIIGGTGGLGRSIAKRMVHRGAKHIVLLSRSGQMTDELRQLSSESLAENTSIHVVACDVGDAAQVNQVLAELRSTLPPIKGVIHAAMVLRDTLFENMSFQQYDSVVRSKVAGAWNIHEALGDQPLDFFIALSSVAGIVGNRGQAAYAAANTFLDALVAHRCQRGLQATSLDLTAIEGVGYLAENAERQAQVLKTLTGTTMSEAEVLELVETAMFGKLEGGLEHQCITGLDFGDPTNLPYYAEDGKLSHLRKAALANSSSMNGDGANPANVPISQRLKQAGSEDTALEVIEKGLSEKLGAILMIPPAVMAAQHATMSISAFGLDSLNAVELRNWIGKELQAHLQILELLTAEMRNRIYEEALYHDRDRGCTANVALLRVSKQVHTEAKGIFHELSTFTINATPTTTQTLSGRYSFIDRIECDGDFTAKFTHDQTSALRIYESFPSGMLQTPNVRINLRLVKYNNAKRRQQIAVDQEGANHFLYALVFFLNSDKAKRKLTVVVSDARQRPSNSQIYISDVLRPLWFLQQKVGLELIVDMPEVPEGFYQRQLERRLTVARDPINPIEIHKRYVKELGKSLEQDEDSASHTMLKAVHWCFSLLQHALVEEMDFLEACNEFDSILSAVCIEAVAIYYRLDGHDDKTNKVRARQCLQRCFSIIEQDFQEDSCWKEDFMETVLEPLCKWFDIKEGGPGFEA